MHPQHIHLAAGEDRIAPQTIEPIRSLAGIRVAKPESDLGSPHLPGIRVAKPESDLGSPHLPDKVLRALEHGAWIADRYQSALICSVRTR
jgi:hypothetical protein